MMLRKMVVIFSTVLLASGVFGQKADKEILETKNKTQKSSEANSSSKERLKNAVLKSQKSRTVSIKVELSIQNKNFVSTFEYAAPNRYSLLETRSGISVKEAIEISGQRFQKKDNQWIKTRKDYLPLREQLELYFPVKFSSLKNDIIKINEVKVVYLGDELLDGKKYSKYQYKITYKELDNIDSGIAWVNQQNGLLERLETENCGLFGASKALFNYYYDKEVKIEEPQNFIVKDWVN